MNAANILKPALAKGEIQVIGATPLMSTESTLKRTPRWKEDSSRCWWMSLLLRKP